MCYGSQRLRDVWVAPAGGPVAKQDTEVAKFCKRCFPQLNNCIYCGDKIAYDQASDTAQYPTGACYNPDKDCRSRYLGDTGNALAAAAWDAPPSFDNQSDDGDMADQCEECGLQLEPSTAVRFYGDGHDYCSVCITAFFAGPLAVNEE